MIAHRCTRTVAIGARTFTVHLKISKTTGGMYEGKVLEHGTEINTVTAAPNDTEDGMKRALVRWVYWHCGVEPNLLLALSGWGYKSLDSEGSPGQG